MNLELRHLRAVCAIAEAGSVTKAAAALGLAPPALTAQLQRIERTLGGALFERDRRGSRPTPLGELVLARARVLLPAIKNLQDEAVRLAGAGQETNRLRIGAVNGPILGGLVHRLSEDLPRATLTTYASWSSDEVAAMVAAGRLDFALVGVCVDQAPPHPEAGLTWHEVATDPVFLLLAAEHPMAGRSEVDLAELADAQWAVTPGDGCFGDCFAAACARAGFTPRTLFETDVGACIDLAMSGHAVVLCQAPFRRAEGLVTVPIAGAPLRWRHLLGWDPQSAAAPLGPRVLGQAKAAHADAAERNPRYLQWLRDRHHRLTV